MKFSKKLKHRIKWKEIDLTEENAKVTIDHFRIILKKSALMARHSTKLDPFKAKLV